MQQFLCSTRIVTGPDALGWLDSQRCRSLLVVTDPYFMENGTAKAIAQRVQAEKREFFAGIRPDPTVELAAEGTALMRQVSPDLLIALGGGSAMDTAKAMVYFAGEGVKFVAIPTTSGSGSEVTNFSVLTHGQVKHPLIDNKMQPQVAILAAELVEKLPPALVAEGGFDVLSHALESFVSTKANPITQALAGSAFSTAFAHLSASHRGDTSVRGKIHLASTMAGLAFSQSGLGLCHALSHSLGGVFHLSHGKLNAVLLPEVISCNAAVAGEQYGKLARMAGLGSSADSVGVRNLRNGLIRLRKELGLPESLQEAGISRRQLWHHCDQIVEAALKDPCMETNPLRGEPFQLRRILEKVSGRG